MRKWIYYIINIVLIVFVFIYCHIITRTYDYSVSGYLTAHALLFTAGIALSARLVKIIYDDYCDRAYYNKDEEYKNYE